MTENRKRNQEKIFAEPLDFLPTKWLRKLALGWEYHRQNSDLTCHTELYFKHFWTDQSKGERRRQALQLLLKHQSIKCRTLNRGLTTTPGTPLTKSDHLRNSCCPRLESFASISDWFVVLYTCQFVTR